MLLPARQEAMRALATELTEGRTGRKDAVIAIRHLVKFERKSAEGSQATIDRSEHDHVKRSGLAALRNRTATIEQLTNAIECLKDNDLDGAAARLIEAANCGGKKSVKAARKQPTVALYVQYLAAVSYTHLDVYKRQHLYR